MNWDNQGYYKLSEWNDNDSSTWKWQLDHIIPQSKLPYTSMEDENFKICWDLENLRPYSAKQNLIEQDRKYLSDEEIQKMIEKIKLKII